MRASHFLTALLCYLSAVGYGFISPQPLTTHEDSELALLMRTMYNDAETIRKAILEKRLPEDFREKFKAIYTAQPTDPEVKDENFTPFTNGFLQALDLLYQNGDDQIENFNTVVHSCIACHQQYCPGPINKIKKLYIHN
ncbi:MAG: hypothetical protein RMJ87_00130 [Cytophagales bacterium]|nr:hypothetical protein [Bernardetiaceae bacterium]MDW8203409.1 hypothetical protein [Cytophagales bacterium]